MSEPGLPCSLIPVPVAPVVSPLTLLLVAPVLPLVLPPGGLAGVLTLPLSQPPCPISLVPGKSISKVVWPQPIDSPVPILPLHHSVALRRLVLPLPVVTHPAVLVVSAVAEDPRPGWDLAIVNLSLITSLLVTYLGLHHCD